MSTERSALLPEDQAIIDEEESILARARAVLQQERAKARPGGGEREAVDTLRALREEAASASADDLPALLLEMNVRQRLLHRAQKEPLPDPNAPYLAHMRVREGQTTKDYLLGHASFVDAASGVRIVDWRLAPVAQIFYRYREGDSYEEEFPGRVAEGVLEARRIVVVANGVVSQIVGDTLVLTRKPDGQWTRLGREALSLAPGGAGTAARPGSLGVGIGLAGRAGPMDVTAQLDADQFGAISAPPEQALLVLGSAGSGKTTVALHRLARIASRDPESYPLSRMHVVVPEEGLARLSRKLLEPLGVARAQVKTLDAWSYELARRVFTDALPRICMDPPALVSSLKRHPALYDALGERFDGLKAASATLRRLRPKLADAFTDRAFLEGVVARARGSLPKSAIEDTVRHTMMQLAEPVDRQLSAIVVPEMKQALDGRAIWEGTPDELAGTLDIEDLPILLFLRAWHAGLDSAPIAHLVLDEAEDFSLFEESVLGKLLDSPPSVTLAGDEAQQTSSSFAGWSRSLETLGVRDAATCRLAVSYRCPRPVTELAQRILGPLAPEAPARAARDGVPVGFFRFPDEGQAQLFLAGAVRDLALSEPRASVGVIASDEDAARRFHELIAELPEARLVLHGEFSFDPGIDVTDIENAKGLEFDYVVVPDACAHAYPIMDDARRRLHVAVTRTSHQLWLVAGGTWSPLVAPFES